MMNYDDMSYAAIFARKKDPGGWFRLYLNPYIHLFGWLSDERFGQKLDFGSLKSPLGPRIGPWLGPERRSDDCTIYEFRECNVMMGVWDSLL